MDLDGDLDMCSHFRNFHADASVGGDNVSRGRAGSVFAQRWIFWRRAITDFSQEACWLCLLLMADLPYGLEERGLGPGLNNNWSVSGPIPFKFVDFVTVRYHPHILRL